MINIDLLIELLYNYLINNIYTVLNSLVFINAMMCGLFYRKVGLLVSHFEADWAPQCKQITDVLTELAQQPATSVSSVPSSESSALNTLCSMLTYVTIQTMLFSSDFIYKD